MPVLLVFFPVRHDGKDRQGGKDREHPRDGRFGSCGEDQPNSDQRQGKPIIGGVVHDRVF